MKAVLLTGIGNVDRLIYSDIETPKISSGQALIKVIYCGVNHLDVHIRSGKRPGPKKFPHILGSEVVGEISNIANGKDFKNGDKVVVYPWTFDDMCEHCKAGNESMCDNMGTFGRTDWGGYAEYIVTPVKNLIKLPQEISEDAACAVTLAGTTAVHLLERAAIKEKSIVLVTGATGGVGTLVVQLLQNKKCTVICATSHEKKKTHLRKMGIKHAISTKNMINEVKKIAPQGVGYVVDIVGGRVWSDALSTLKKNGTMVFCSTSRDEKGSIDIANAFAKQLNILGVYGGSKKNLETALVYLEKGIIKPIIDEVFSLRDARKAHEMIDTQQIFGKILLRSERL